MGDKSKIEWTDATWNPIRARNRATGAVGWFCIHASAGCAGCYAESMNLRLGSKLPFKPGHLKDHDLFLDPEMLTQPLRWKKPRKIFVCSMTDLFADFVPAIFIDRIFAVMALSPQHTFQILTKRTARMREHAICQGIARRIWDNADEIACHLDLGDHHPGTPFLQAGKMAAPWPLPNVWLGTSVEDQANANARIPQLLATPAAVKFLSCEPLLAPIDLDRIHCGDGVYMSALHGGRETETPWHVGWVICGGESGRGARPMHPAWPRSLRDQCAAAGIPFHFKQWGEWANHIAVAGGDLGGDVRRGRVRIVHPTGQTDVEVSIATGGRSTIPGSRYMERVGKSLAGRQLDGIEHDGFPL